jgi:hypothetical protein
MNIVWAKLAVILACTLAGDRGAFEFAHWGVSAPVNAPPEDDGVCHSSCVALDLSVSLTHAVAPTPIAATAWLLAALPTLLMRSRRRTMGVRACLWQLLMLWLNLVIAYSLFTRQRVWGYVWALHATVHTLTAWAPHRRVLVLHGSHRVMTLAGVAAVCCFAWRMGPPVGLIAWRGGWPSQCGLTAHLLAVLGVDLIGWVLAPVGALVVG